ncbi:MAG: 50S ribosomal protein L34 [Candidatus Paceibacterota bacterium]|jgi:large subunit ribosomal protein L34
MGKMTYQPKKKKRATTHGFLARAKTSAGRKIVKGRRRAGRTRLAV